MLKLMKTDFMLCSLFILIRVLWPKFASPMTRGSARVREDDSGKEKKSKKLLPNWRMLSFTLNMKVFFSSPSFVLIALNLGRKINNLNHGNDLFCHFAHPLCVGQCANCAFRASNNWIIIIFSALRVFGWIKFVPFFFRCMRCQSCMCSEYIK